MVGVDAGWDVTMALSGTTTGYYSMERISASGSGDSASNLANNNGVTKNGTNSGGGAINGIPRAKNSVTP